MVRVDKWPVVAAFPNRQASKSKRAAAVSIDARRGEHPGLNLPCSPTTHARGSSQEVAGSTRTFAISQARACAAPKGGSCDQKGKGSNTDGQRPAHKTTIRLLAQSRASTPGSA